MHNNTSLPRATHMLNQVVVVVEIFTCYECEFMEVFSIIEPNEFFAIIINIKRAILAIT